MLAVENIGFYGTSASSNRVSGSWYAPSGPSPAGNAASRTSVTIATTTFSQHTNLTTNQAKDAITTPATSVFTTTTATA